VALDAQDVAVWIDFLGDLAEELAIILLVGLDHVFQQVLFVLQLQLCFVVNGMATRREWHKIWGINVQKGSVSIMIGFQ